MKKNVLKQLKMSSGYPRFVQHRFLNQLISYENKITGSDGKRSFLFSDANHCANAININKIENPVIIERDDYTLLQIVMKNAKMQKCINPFFSILVVPFLQDKLRKFLSKKESLPQEKNISEQKNADHFARDIIAKVHGQGVTSRGVLISSSGANAFYSLFWNAQKKFIEKGKKIWIQLGWLYLDTIEVMKLVGGENNVIHLSNPTDAEELKRIFELYGKNIAGVVTEFPTNPLLQCCDLEEVRSLCDSVDGMLIVDPTMASPKNSKVVELADAWSTV